MCSQKKHNQPCSIVCPVDTGNCNIPCTHKFTLIQLWRSGAVSQQLHVLANHRKKLFKDILLLWQLLCVWLTCCGQTVISNPTENHHDSITNISSGLYIYITQNLLALFLITPDWSWMREGFFFKAELVLANMKNQHKMKNISLYQKKGLMLWYHSRMDKLGQRKLLQGQIHPKTFLTILSATYYIFSLLTWWWWILTCNKVLPEPNLSATFLFFLQRKYTAISSNCQIYLSVEEKLQNSMLINKLLLLKGGKWKIWNGHGSGSTAQKIGKIWKKWENEKV